MFDYAGNVAPFTGAWIEIVCRPPPSFGMEVAPFTGAWIEISAACVSLTVTYIVAPFTGAWIEISLVMWSASCARSLPSREHGLKSSSVDK